MINKLIVLIFFFNAALLFPDSIVLTDTDENWVVEVADFKTQSDSPDALFIAKTLPAFLYNELSISKTHELSENEIELLQKNIVNKEISLLENQLSIERKKLDLHYLRGAGNIREIRKAISDINKKISSLERFNYEKIKIIPEKDIFYKNSEVKAEKPVFNVINIDNYAEKERIDHLIYGNFDLFDNLVYIEIFLYNRLEKKIVFSRRIVTEIDSVLGVLEEPVAELTSYLLGRPWSRLDVITQDSNADIYINDTFRGSRDVRNIILKPGFYSVVVEGQGIERKEREIFLRDRDYKILEIDAEYEEERLIAINTYPRDADIYFDSVWNGKSPSLVNGLKGEVFIKKDGYRDMRIFLEDYAGNNLNLELSPDLFKKEDFLLQKRNNYYRNLSYFILSIPVPLFMFALVNDYNSAYARAYESESNYDEIERLRETRSYLYYGYYSTLFISISLFTNMIFHLGDYIEAGDVLKSRR